MTQRRPSDRLGDYCESLRALLAAPDLSGGLQAAEAPRLIARFGRALLRQCPADTLLVDAFARLSERGFTLPPPPPEALPRVDAARVLSRWSEADRQALAASVLTLPDPSADPALALSLLELFLTLPSERARARLLLEALRPLARRGADPALTEEAWELLSLRLTLTEHHEGGTRPSWGQLLQPFRRSGSEEALREALTRAAAFELDHPVTVPTPHGLSWLVPCLGGAAVANTRLALMRRPALGDEAARLIDWLVEAGPAPALAEAEAADEAGDIDGGTRLLIEALERDASPDEKARVLEARRALIEDAGLGRRGVDALFPTPEGLSPERPRSGWPQLLKDIFDREPLALASPDELSLAETIGATRLAAEYRLATRDPGVIAYTRLLGRQRVLEAFPERPPEDERLLADAMDLALLHHHLMEAGLPRSLLALRLLGAGVCPLGAETPEVGAEDPEQPISTDDPHHPEQRLEAARALLEAEQHVPAAAILISLLRKADRKAQPRSLHAVIADALEADEPPADLLVAVARALEDDARNAPLLEVLAARPLAAYGLHEELYDLAIDPSRDDLKRLRALEAWLGIWIASEAPPDEVAVGRIRETAEPLLILAAARLSSSSAPLHAACAFAQQSGELDHEAFASSLLHLALGRAEADDAGPA